MKVTAFLHGIVALTMSGALWGYGQCSAPELVKGADKYNALVCQGVLADQKGMDREALGYFLSASQQPTLESPNIFMFGRIAKTYARLGQFHEADVFLKYDDISLLWLIGVVRCTGESGSGEESLEPIS